MEAKRAKTIQLKKPKTSRGGEDTAQWTEETNAGGAEETNAVGRDQRSEGEEGEETGAGEIEGGEDQLDKEEKVR